MENDLRGNILRIEKSSIFDGSGLRTVVFFKGCPLRCRWCSTPESQSFAPQRGHDTALCAGCGLCASQCPTKMGPDDHRAADCQFCGNCVTFCPQHANIIYGREMQVSELLEIIAKDDVFYFHSDGGLTLSGGEPLCQPEFAAALLKGARELGVHTAIESSFYAPYPAVEQLLPHLDHVFCDIKHMDAAAHLSHTGVDNQLILENITAAAASPFPFTMTARLPLIPGLNDSTQNLTATARFCATLARPVQLELLPYHRLGLNTYRKLGLPDPLPGVEPPSAAEMADYRKIAANAAPGLVVR